VHRPTIHCNNVFNSLYLPDFRKQLNAVGYGPEGHLYGAGSYFFGENFLLKKHDPEGQVVWASTLPFHGHGAIASFKEIGADDSVYISGNVTGPNFENLVAAVKYKQETCAPLETDNFKQCNVTWKDEVYDNIPPETICTKGCALTSLSMLNNYYYRASQQVSITSTTPNELNRFLIDHGTAGYTIGGSVLFSGIELLNGEIEYIGRFDLGNPWIDKDLLNFMDEDLKAKRPVICHVKPKHFVLVTGKCGSDYVINDPASQTRNIISAANLSSELIGLRRFRGP
jgi:hypothetical protein